MFLARDSGFSAWNDFSEYVSDHCLEWGETANAKLSRANARYRAAKDMEISFPGYRDTTADGYSDLLRVSVAYSALEVLDKAISAHVKEFESPSIGYIRLIDERLADSCENRVYSRLFDSLENNLSSSHLKAEVRDLHSGNSETGDITCLVKSIRHLTFHGQFTPATIGYKTGNEVHSLMSDLRGMTLAEVDSYFCKWVRRLV